MRVSVKIEIDYDEATISKEEAERRVSTLLQNALDNDSGILTDGGAVLDSVGEVDVVING